MEYSELIKMRHSTRGFDGRLLTEKQLCELVTAGTLAPNACNMQSWHFYATCDKSRIEGLFPDVHGREWIKSAGAVIVVCTENGDLIDRFGDRAKSLFVIQDTAAAATQILLKAADMGMSGCFVGAFNEYECRKYFAIPDNRRPVIMLPIGYEVTPEVPEKSRKPLDEVLTII